MTNCLNLQDVDVQRWINNEGIESTYSIYLQNGYLPDYNEWKQMNVGIKIEEARDVLASILPIDMFQIAPLSNIIDSLPINTVGAYLNDVIYLNETPTLSEVYEEGFHAILDKLVSPLEKSQLLKASQAVLADRLKKEGNTINNYLKEISEKYPELYSGQSREQQLNRLYEEELASMFIDSKQYKNPFTLENGIKKRLSPILGNSIASSIASIITKVFNYLKSIFNMYKSNEDTISMFFKAINDGKFKGKEIQGEGSNSVPFTRLLELKIEEYDDVFEETITHIKRYTPEETQSVIRNVGAIYFQLENERIDNKKSDRIQRAIELYFQLSKEIGEYKDVDVSAEINNDNVELLKQDVLSYIDEFKSIVDFDSDVIESEDETSNSFADFESSADEKDPLQSSFSKTLKLRIGKTGRVKYLSSVQIPINNEENKEVYIKLIESVDVVKTYYSIARALRNTPNDEDRWNKLMMFSNLEGNKDTRAFVEQLLFDLFRNHELVRNEGKGTPNEYETKLNKIKDLYNSRAKGFVIFPQIGEEENVISSGNAVIINSIIKGFDLYSRTNYTVTFDVLNKKAKSFDSNLKNVKKIQTDTWKNTLLELKDSGYKLSTSDKYLDEYFDNFQPSAFNVDELESKTNRVFNFFNAIKIPISREYIKYSIASNSGFDEQGFSILKDSTTDALLSTFKVPKDNLLNNNVLKELYNRVYSYLNNDGDLQELYDNKLGIKGRLDNIAEGNGYFDERIPDSTYKTADGKTKFNYQYKTWHLQKVTAMLEKPDDISTYDVLVSNDILREGRQLIESNYLFNKFKTKEFKDLIKDGKIDVFSADGIRLSEDDVLQDGRVVKKGRNEDGVSVGKMSNRDFMIYLFNLSAGKTSSAGLSPVYFGNYEASKTYEFINLPLIKDVIDDNGDITSLAIDMLSKEIEKEFNRIKEIAGTEQFDTTYTKYNTGKRFKIQYKDRTFYMPYAEKNGVKSINFGNFRAGAFSDYVNNLSELEFDKPFTDYINALMNSGVTEATIEDEINSKNPLVLAYLGEDFSKAELNIAKNVNDMNNNLVSMLEQQGVINGNENILIDSFYLGNNKLATTYGFKSGELKNNLKRKIMSDFLNTMYLNQLLQGDQALLYKNDLVDIFKRFKGRNAAIVSFNTSTIAPDLGITEKWETLNYVVHEEIQSRSGIDTENIDQADAQNYTTTKYMRHALYAMGRLTKDTASLLDKIEQGEPIDESVVFDMEVYTPILKTVHFDGRNYLKKSDYMLSKSVTSRFVEITDEEEAKLHGEIDKLTGQWKPKNTATKEVVKWSNGKYYEVLPNQNKELHERRKVMEGWRYDDKTDSWNYTGKQIMLSMPISASKMLNRNTLKGHDLKNLKDKNINTLDLQYYGLQVETPHPHDTIPDPTQYLEIALNELNRTRSTEFIIDGNKYNVDQLENLYQEALVQRRAMRIDSLMNEILDEDNNSKLDEFRERFAKSLISSGAEKQTVELVAEGYNMNIPLIRDKYISQIFSHFTKDGLSQKRKGDAAAHISSYGHKLVKKVVKHTVNGNDVWSWTVIPSGSKEYNDALSTELNDYSSRDFYPDVNGKPSKNREKHVLDGKDNSLQTALSELGEGQYFIDELRHLKPRIVDGVITGYFTEMILAKYNRNQSQISDEERYMFGVRIPSQDKHSGVNLEWVDMLPPNYGSAVIVAKEIVQLSGSDFDIDKLYISKPEGYYTKEGFKKYTNSLEDFIKYQLANNRELKDLVNKYKEESSAYNKFKTIVSEIRQNKKEDYKLLKKLESELELSLVSKEYPLYSKIIDLTKRIDDIDVLIEYGYATTQDLDMKKSLSKEMSYLYKNISATKSQILSLDKDVVDNFSSILEDYYLSLNTNNILYNDSIDSLQAELKRLELLALEQLNLPYNEETYNEYISKYGGYGNRGYINNLLLQANQQALANEQTLDNGGISDTPASMGYMAEGVLKEFPMILGDNTFQFKETSKTKLDYLLQKIVWNFDNTVASVYDNDVLIAQDSDEKVLISKIKEYVNNLNLPSENINNKTYEGDIKELKDNQVFVFGANSLGLHGRGSAGVAMGEQRSLSQIKDLPDGSKGNWAVKGATGFMEGLKGNSYGLITVLGEPQGRNNPNKISIEQLKNNIKDFYDFAKANPEKEFLLAYSGKNPDVLNLNGYTSRQLASFFSSFEIPENIVFEKEFYNLLDKKPLQSNSGNKEYLLSKDGKTYVNANKTKYNVHHLLGQIITDKNNRTGKANIGVDVNWNLLNIVLNRIGAGINPNNAIAIKINGVTKTFDSLELFLQSEISFYNPSNKLIEYVNTIIPNIISSKNDEIQLASTFKTYELLNINSSEEDLKQEELTLIENKKNILSAIEEYKKGNKKLEGSKYEMVASLVIAELIEQGIPLKDVYSNIFNLQNQINKSIESSTNNNLRVFDVISTLISSATDEAKEQLNARYGLNIDALNAVLPFVAMGGNLSIALALVNQPIVKMFLEYKDKKNYAITTEDESKLKTLSTFGIVEKILDSIGMPKNALDSIDNVTYSIEDLALGLRGKTKINSPKSLKMLNDFLKLVEITEWGSNLVAVIKLKKGVPSDIYSFETQLSKINALQLNNKEVDGSEYPINIKKALLDNKDTKAKELIGAIDVVNRIASILPKFVAIKSNAFNTIRESVIKEAKRLNNDNLKELNSELESFIYGQYYNELLKDAGVEDASIIKYITTLLIDKDAEQNIKNEFIKFKNASKNSDVLRNNPLLNKLEIMENDNIVGLKLNQLVKLSDTQMTELSDAYTFLTKLKEPLEDSISPNEFSKMLFALYIVKDGFQFKYDGVSKIFPAEMFSRLSTVIQDVQDNKFDGDKYKDVFIERYFESVKHTNQINFISPKSINTSDFKLIGNQDEFKIAYFNIYDIQSLDDNNSNNTKDGNVLRYIRIGWDKNVYLMKYKGVDGNNYVYEEFIPSGNSNITTMSIPLNESIYSAPVKYNKKQQEIILNKEVISKGKKIINVYWSQAESDTSTRILSNLAPRKFTYESTDGITREYGSVEHAYQSNKNGKFDATTYNDYVAKGGYGVKISPKLTEVGKRGNLQLMKDLVVESFIQNPNSEASKKLLQYDEFTHNTNELIDKAFLEGLYLAKKELKNNSNAVSPLPTEPEVAVNLTPEQKIAVDKAVDFINNGNSKEFFLIEGKAGTGKTYCIKEVLKKYPNKSIIVSALSHKAKGVIRNSIISGGVMKAHYYTIAGMLGLKLNMKTGEFEKDYDNYNTPPIENADIIIVDEASMVNEEALELIMREKSPRAKVIFMGDSGQLPPIRTSKNPYYKNKLELVENSPKSPVFKTENKAQLFTRMRQGEESPILPFADYYWNNNKDGVNSVLDPAKGHKNTIINNKGALIFTDSKGELLDKTLPLFKQALEDNNVNLIKYVSYRNDTRQQVNLRVHNYLFGANSDVFSKGEIIIFNDTYEGIENSTEIDINEILDESTILDGSVRIINFNIIYDNELVHVSSVHPEDQAKYDEYVSDLFNKADELKGKDKFQYKQALNAAWAAEGRYAKVDYGYAITSHKSQGSTYDVVIVDEKDILSVSPISNRQKSESIYTAITRAKNITLMLSSGTDSDIPNLQELNNRINSSKENKTEDNSDTLKEISNTDMFNDNPLSPEELNNYFDTLGKIKLNSNNNPDENILSIIKQLLPNKDTNKIFLYSKVENLLHGNSLSYIDIRVALISYKSLNDPNMDAQNLGQIINNIVDGIKAYSVLYNNNLENNSDTSFEATCNE